MRYNFFLIIILLFSCSSINTGNYEKPSYNSKGFALIFNEQDYNNKVIKGKLDNNLLEIAHPNLRINSLVKIKKEKTNEEAIEELDLGGAIVQ